jgi:regulator of sigma E protease
VSWALAFVGFAVLIILHEAGHFAAAKAVGMRVERFSLFFPPLVARRQVGETEYAIGAVPLGGYVKISGMNPSEDLPDEVRTRAYTSQPVWKRITVIAAGPLVNLVLAFLLFLVFFWAIGAETPTREVGAVQKGMPAASVLEPGDEIVAVDGRPGTVEQFRDRIAAHRCAQRPPADRCRAATPASVTVERDGSRRTFRITPVYDAAEKRTRIGFAYGYQNVPLSFGDALDTSADRFWFITRETVKLPARLLDPERRKEISGVVGSYETTRQTILFDIDRVIVILGVISLSLAIINLFPFLPLDGGHIFWSLVEKVRGKAVPFSVMERAGFVGFMLVAMLFIIGFTNDIDRLSGEGFQVR